MTQVIKSAKTVGIKDLAQYNRLLKSSLFQACYTVYFLAYHIMEKVPFAITSYLTLVPLF
ncbi:hypothetical protein [Mucilaginibacter aquariorum]|uniref:MFS transporter n=1 Tax=Mucilaginibacter aquariorum TaxID=2967225 RepID=A0ABT1SVX2_9SPHI|nr:hypothetical protein [Mucilaginibacter aquariorum]MCQ6956412.1 hypothetical protein [Mucilaginibacter aquariorum]